MSAFTSPPPRLSMTVCVVLALMSVSVSVIVVRAVSLVLTHIEESGSRYSAFLIFSALLAIAPAIIAVALLFLGSRVFPFAATLVGLLGVVEVFYGLDPVSLVVVVASAAIVVVAWLPSTRAFVAARREYRAGAKRARPQE